MEDRRIVNLYWQRSAALAAATDSLRKKWKK